MAPENIKLVFFLQDHTSDFVEEILAWVIFILSFGFLGYIAFIDKEKVGHFRMPPIRVAEDMAMHLFILKKGIIAYSIGEYLAKVRIVKNSLSSNKFKQIKDVWQVYRKYEKLNLLESCYHYSYWVANAVKKRIL